MIPQILSAKSPLFRAITTRIWLMLLIWFLGIQTFHRRRSAINVEDAKRANFWFEIWTITKSRSRTHFNDYKLLTVCSLATLLLSDYHLAMAQSQFRMKETRSSNHFIFLPDVRRGCRCDLRGSRNNQNKKTIGVERTFCLIIKHPFCCQVFRFLFFLYPIFF
jgi:hypothetical protein